MSEIDLNRRVRAAIDESELIRNVSDIETDAVKFVFRDEELRKLTNEEIAQLQGQGNSSSNWSRVRVTNKFNPRTIRNSTFHNEIVLGNFSAPVEIDGAKLSSGVFNSTLSNCVIGDDCLVRDVRFLSKYVVAKQAKLVNCGSIACDGETTFGNGAELPLGLETGGREVAIYAEIDVEVAAAVAKSRSDKEQLEEYSSAVAQYKQAATSNRGIIGENAFVRDTPQIRNSYIGQWSMISGATLVSDSTLLSNDEEPSTVASGACVLSSIIQWGSAAATMAIVERSVLTEHSYVKRHGKVANSILGPNTSISSGEVTASLLGPCVGFNHQSLLISAIWPEGRGNVGYGANVGSNHTSKLPDQEIWPGEGTFFGLGVNVKFPSNFRQAPYLMIASGANTLPQKVTFPFSLINTPSSRHEDISPAYNEIVPAWVLTDNMFALKRNEQKFKQRNQARRTEFDFDAFHPKTVDMMLDACRRLESVSKSNTLFTDRDIEGLGKNYMLEENRQPAIDAYRRYTKYYVLLGLMNVVKKRIEKEESIDELLTSETECPKWEHKRRLLREEFDIDDVSSALEDLPGILEDIARAVEQSKAKDNERGERIIDDYADVHSPASDHEFVQQTWDDTRQVIDELSEIIGQIS